MVFIKKLVANGFKSFGKKTEVLFDKGINVIVGPNGSGKSNISDALCFALGRLSIKSMRAAKSSNMIFMGSKYVRPAGEASVEVIFDNSDRTFGIDKEEISVKRIVRRNGQGIYKINDETKTRNELIEMLLQAGIDPYGYNIILQGKIQELVRMHPDERRKIIEEVAGISVYEIRKEMSLKELEKTNEKIKTINAVLRQRTIYLKNLESERAQALHYKDLENNLRRTKASIITKKIEEKQKELDKILKTIDEKSKQKDKLREGSINLQGEIEAISGKIEQINRHIKEATGVEQETLHNQVATLKGELGSLEARKENYENRKAETEKRMSELAKSIPEFEKEIQELKKKSPLVAKKADELKKKKQELEQIEEEREKLLSSRTELNSLRERIRDKENYLARIVGESDSSTKELEKYSLDLIYENEEGCLKIANSLKEKIQNAREKINKLGGEELGSEKKISVLESEIEKAEKVKSDVRQIDICPLCQSKITENHKEHVNREADNIITLSLEKIEELKEDLIKLKEEKVKRLNEIESAEEKSSIAKLESAKHRTIKEKKAAIKKIAEEEKLLKDEIKVLEEKKKIIESKTDDLSKIEKKYDSKRLEIEEISSRTEENVGATLLSKERDIENIRNVIKGGKKDLEDLELSIKEISENIERKSNSLDKKEEQERELNERFKRLFDSRDKMQAEMQGKNLSLSELQNEIKMFDEQVNYLRVGQAKYDAEKETLQVDMSAYAGVELMKISMQMLEERLAKTEEAMRAIGSINMRALETYEGIKVEYDAIQEKANVLLKEEDEIKKIIDEIDRKKTRTFMKTFHAINELFTSNFAKLYTKGAAFLEIENKEKLFEGGIGIEIRLAKGKYFDVNSLSGGEQTMVALALLFAIQEHKPYHFYIFDEIDAALDKRNSERLAALLNQYMKAGQYIVITHNDAIILDSDVLYGVSMHDGVTKILSLNLSEEANIKQYLQPQPQVQEIATQEIKEENPFKDNNNNEITPS
jgi:chromosome segregation protein